ncbi:MAG TPA: HAD family hydrolase [Methanomicrobiales archaeon]|nr:HAD family hydrolase [Methanomicrobiales archaeon]
MGINACRSWVFDCDGVILDSNPLKSRAFYQVSLPYGGKKAEAFLRYHQGHGGISRFEKFRYFFEVILGRENYREEMEGLLANYGALVREGMLEAAETPHLREFLDGIPAGTRRYVLSGGSQEELREILRKRDLSRYFDGIFGSPESKDAILTTMIARDEIPLPALFIGDSRYDYEVAGKHGLCFIFMSGFSEFKGGIAFFRKIPEVRIIRNLGDLCKGSS